jgi:hypothetical protein
MVNFTVRTSVDIVRTSACVRVYPADAVFTIHADGKNRVRASVQARIHVDPCPRGLTDVSARPRGRGSAWTRAAQTWHGHVGAGQRVRADMHGHVSRGQWSV